MQHLLRQRLRALGSPLLTSSSRPFSVFSSHDTSHIHFNNTTNMPNMISSSLSKYDPDFVLMNDLANQRSLTVGEFDSWIKKIASSIHLEGFKKGDVVLINTPNNLEYGPLLHGANLAGTIVSPASPQHTVDELAQQMEMSSTKIIITSEQQMEDTIKAAKKYGAIKPENIFVITKDGKDLSNQQLQGCRPFNHLLNADPVAPPVEVDVSDIALLPFSSGTTGKPKGVILNHKNIMSNLMQISAAEEAKHNQDVFVGVLPFFHIYGLMVVLNLALHKGVKSSIMSAFDFEAFLNILEKEKVTIAHIAPPIALAMAKHPIVDKFDLSSLKTLFSAAAPLGAEVEDQVKARLGCTVRQAYGMTELSPASHVIYHGKEKSGSCGKLLPGTSAMIVDLETGEKLGPNKVGEICVKGDQVMVGYLNNEEATKQTIDENGFLHTGDTGYVDEDGFFFVVDRVKELIKRKGHQVAPAELEALLLDHDKIADCAVVRGYDEDGEEMPQAFIVLKPEQTESAEGIMEFVAKQVAPYKKIKKVTFIDVIPKSASGKILRRLLENKK